MAKVADLNDSWFDSVAERPLVIQEMCRRYPPNLLYYLNPPGQYVTIYSYFENGTVCVNVMGDFNHLLFPRCVFGIDPKHLTECEIPDEEGSVLFAELDEPTQDLLRDILLDEGTI